MALPSRSPAATPLSRDHSPGCGVMTAGLGNGDSNSMTAPIVQTVGIDHQPGNPHARSLVEPTVADLRLPWPGPMATQAALDS
ncbi:MAG: hypothetical protein R3C56_05265 [Pirellulaceae bacterium]